jgi:hypothetical protein
MKPPCAMDGARRGIIPFFMFLFFGKYCGVLSVAKVPASRYYR